MKAFNSVETAADSIEREYSWTKNILNIKHSQSCISIEVDEEDKENVFDKVKSWFEKRNILPGFPENISRNFAACQKQSLKCELDLSIKFNNSSLLTRRLKFYNRKESELETCPCETL